MKKLILGLVTLMMALPAYAQVYQFTPSSFSGGTLTSGVTFSGLQGPATFGSDIVTNGTFTGSATGWTLGGGGGAPDWAYATNNVTHGNGGGTAALTPSTPLSVVAGTRYAVQVTISGYSAGTLTVGIGGASGSAMAFNTTQFYAMLVATTTANLTLTPTTTFVGTVDDVKVFAATEVPISIAISNGGTFPVEIRGSATGQANTFMGDDSGAVATSSAIANTAFGTNALQSVTVATDNSAFGTSTLREVGNGIRNTAMGRSALRNLRDGSNNTTVGYLAGTLLLQGDQNQIFGSFSGDVLTNLSNVNVFGYNIDPTVSNVGIFGNASVTDVAFGSAASATTGLAYIHAKGVEVATTFANLGAVVVGALKVCSDCNIASPCTGAGAGALAVGIGAAWVCK